MRKIRDGLSGTSQTRVLALKCDGVADGVSIAGNASVMKLDLKLVSEFSQNGYVYDERPGDLFLLRGCLCTVRSRISDMCI
jgi:hypothetical protein